MESTWHTADLPCMHESGLNINGIMRTIYVPPDGKKVCVNLGSTSAYDTAHCSGPLGVVYKSTGAAVLFGELNC